MYIYIFIYIHMCVCLCFNMIWGYNTRTYGCLGFVGTRLLATSWSRIRRHLCCISVLQNAHGCVVCFRKWTQSTTSVGINTQKQNAKQTLVIISGEGNNMSWVTASVEVSPGLPSQGGLGLGCVRSGPPSVYWNASWISIPLWTVQTGGVAPSVRN